jgi:hypothetical protein
MKNYVTARLPRAGLGHSLRAYSRAFAYYARGEAEFIHPNWFKIRIGPYLRNEKDKRNYWRYIKTPKTWGLNTINNWRILTHRIVSEENFNPNDQGQFLIIKDKNQNTFSHIAPFKEEFAQKLETLSAYKISAKDKSPTIGIFHRSGDFKQFRRPITNDEYLKRTHMWGLNDYGYIPPEYAADALKKCRNILGWDVPAVLSTDANENEVKCILALGKVRFSRSNSALANMLEMRHHNILIIGKSSYGLWSYFLGNAFGIFPRSKNMNDNYNPLGIPKRKGAWFVFGHHTSLNNQNISDEMKKSIVK